MTEHVDVKVSYSNQAYNASARGKRASSTHSPAAAAERLGEKIFGGGFIGVMALPPETGDDHTVNRYRLAGDGEA